MGPAYHKGVPCPWGSLESPLMSLVFMRIHGVALVKCLVGNVNMYIFCLGIGGKLHFLQGVFNYRRPLQATSFLLNCIFLFRD